MMMMMIIIIMLMHVLYMHHHRVPHRLKVLIRSIYVGVKKLFYFNNYSKNCPFNFNLLKCRCLCLYVNVCVCVCVCVRVCVCFYVCTRISFINCRVLRFLRFCLLATTVMGKGSIVDSRNDLEIKETSPAYKSQENHIDQLDSETKKAVR